MKCVLFLGCIVDGLAKNQSPLQLWEGGTKSMQHSMKYSQDVAIVMAYQCLNPLMISMNENQQTMLCLSSTVTGLSEQ